MWAARLLASQRLVDRHDPVASQLGRAWVDAEYLGAPGSCPMCRLDVVVLAGRQVECATCGARGHLGDDFEVVWTELSTSVISLEEKRAHYVEIVETVQRHAAQRAVIDERALAYASFPVTRPAAETVTVSSRPGRT